MPPLGLRSANSRNASSASKSVETLHAGTVLREPVERASSGIEAVPSLPSRIVHGQRQKHAFTLIMDLLGRLSPQFSFSLRTSISQAVFPLRPPTTETAPTLRADVACYADLFHEAAANFERVVSRYHGELNWSRARISNGYFQTIDAELYHCMIRFLRPRRIIEVGAGNSTWFARDALRANGLGELLAIDPSPRLLLPKECRHLKSRVEEVDLAVFRELQENDILFIDSSHTRDEAIHHVERIYPILRPGVFIHHHDVLFPFLGFTSFIPDWERLGEQEVLLEFFKNNKNSCDVFTSSAFVCYQDPGLVWRLVPSRVYMPRRAGGSIWIRKKGSASDHVSHTPDV
jgi:Methyltransferase domain